MFGEKANQTSTITGLVDYSLSGLVPDWNTWRSQIADGGAVFYVAENDDASVWEIGWGTLTYGTTDSISRNVLVSSTGSKINWDVTDAPIYVYSATLGTAVKFLLQPFIQGLSNVPGWLPSGAKWLDYSIGWASGAYSTAAAWVKRTYIAGTRTALASHAEEGRFHLGLDSGTTHIFAASQRVKFEDKGAANATITKDDIGKCFVFNCAAAVRSITMLAHDADGMGHGAYIYVLPRGSSSNGVTFIPGGSDTTDLATAPPGRMTKFYWDGANSVWRSDANAVDPTRGRLTLSTGLPVMTGAVTAATTVHFTPVAGAAFAELSNDLTASSTGKAGPAAAAANKNYDLFVWNDGGTWRLTRGPAWSSDTARGTGAGTTEIQRVNGTPVNKQDITNGPIAGQGVFVGTICTNGSSQIDWQPGGFGTGGTAAFFGVWNMFNRVDVGGTIGDTTSSWTYSSATIRPANNSTNNRVTAVCGLQEDMLEASYQVPTVNSSNSTSIAGIGFNSTTAFSGRQGALNTNGGIQVSTVEGSHRASFLGKAIFQALEASNTTGTTSWYGSGTGAQSGLAYKWRC